MRTKSLLLSPDSAEGGAASAEVTTDVALLQKENAELKEQLAAVKKPGALTPEQEKFVRERVRVGLTREQAVGVLQAQQDWDAELERQEKEAAKKGKKAA